MAKTSGLDSLLDALKQSGVDVGGMGGGAAQSGAGAGKEGPGSQPGGDAGGAGSRRGASAWNPFSGFPFGQGFAGKGERAHDGGAGDPPRNEAYNPFANLASWGKKRIIVSAVLALVILYVAYWWFHPPISINSVDTWFFVAIFILAPAFLILRARSNLYKRGGGKIEASPKKTTLFRRLSFLPAIVLAIGVVGAIASLDLFPGNAEKYANILQTEQLDFAEDIQEVDYSQIPIIDHDSAELLGNREMGQIPEYVSQFEISSLYSQINYQGTPVRVSPLGYADLFKWLTNRADGIPAYAIVDMTTQDAQIVRLGEGNGMKYTASEPLARNIDRYVQLKYPFYIFDEKSFEIDEDGHPWWICPVRSYTIGLFGGETIERFIMCDAVTGACEEIPIAEAPQWVDRAYPSNLLIRQYNWSGAYIHGWFNSWLGQSGVYQTTPGTDGKKGYNYVAKDDDVWVYTGVTSATSDSSIIGFVLINQRTAESHYYAVAGATEDSAMGSAEGQVQHLRYTSTFPLLINVADVPTYFMALKDAAGLVKQFAMIDIQRYQNVAVGDTVAACQKSYEALLATNGALVGSRDQPALNLPELKGTIRSMTQATIDGNSHFYVTIENEDGIYDFALPGLLEIVGYQVGDTIAFTYVKTDPVNAVNAITSVGPAGPVEVTRETLANLGGSKQGAANSSAAEGAAAGTPASGAAVAGVPDGKAAQP